MFSKIVMIACGIYVLCDKGFSEFLGYIAVLIVIYAYGDILRRLSKLENKERPPIDFD